MWLTHVRPELVSVCVFNRASSSLQHQPANQPTNRRTSKAKGNTDCICQIMLIERTTSKSSHYSAPHSLYVNVLQIEVDCFGKSCLNTDLWLSASPYLARVRLIREKAKDQTIKSLLARFSRTRNRELNATFIWTDHGPWTTVGRGAYLDSQLQLGRACHPARFLLMNRPWCAWMKRA